MIENLHYSTQTNRNIGVDDAGDSSEPLMNMLKKMYAEGDDEMKRMLNKAWTESQEKKMKGDMMDLWNTVEGVAAGVRCKENLQWVNNSMHQSIPLKACMFLL